VTLLTALAAASVGVFFVAAVTLAWLAAALGVATHMG
jgi:hypothetical protein